MASRTHKQLGPRDPESAQAYYERLTPDERIALLVTRDASIRLLTELHKEAIADGINDALTGVLNRRGLNKEYSRGSRHWQRSGEGTKPDLLVMVDLDEFKNINDTRGHTEGDRSLRKVAGLIGATVRDGDAVGRYGGDEFVALLYGSTLDEGNEVAERIAANAQILREQEATKENPATIPTFSIGVAEIDYLLSPSFDEAAELADGAMYEAKRGGRDQVHVLS